MVSTCRTNSAFGLSYAVSNIPVITQMSTEGAERTSKQSWKRGTSCGESFTDHLIRDCVVSGLVGNINLLGKHMHRCTAGRLR